MGDEGVDGGWRAATAALRPSDKVLPEHARAHNRALVLKHLFHEGHTSRADLARATGLTRVTISDLVTVLLAAGLVEELGTRMEGRVGKPAILLGLRFTAFQVVTIDVGTGPDLIGGVVDLTGEFVVRRSLPIDGRTGDELVGFVTRFARLLVAAATRPVIGVGIAAPGVITATGDVTQAPSRGWFGVALGERLTEALGLPVHVVNDANATVLSEFTYGGADGAGLMVLMVREGVGAGVVLDGVQVRGHGDAAGEIGHVRVVEEGGLECHCGRTGCLETVLSASALRARLVGLDEGAGTQVRAEVGTLLGTALAPVVATLNLAEVVLSGPVDLLDGIVRETAQQTVQDRTMAAIGNDFRVRMAVRPQDDVLAGAVAAVLARQLGVS
ncbi:ROK family transcriptional regulator [Sanguibacter antarcticus]|uniref:Putative NBD/HSP70 family sugar kinase n=1 Tax=Sanguibacter antarcticus TaxID=372484 RepID=A0A2A9E4A0_9MICO|nr:ROK family transcriptional regulator [Sanguibacter antarcticus]PFG33674.1 putative NBD/HSP70 family sugar kinase [Sanguibacter antarcticus]